jgi:hypothetical protein
MKWQYELTITWVLLLAVAWGMTRIFSMDCPNDSGFASKVKAYEHCIKALHDLTQSTDKCTEILRMNSSTSTYANN